MRTHFSSSAKKTCVSCLAAARVLRGLPVFVVRPGENVPAVSLHRHRDPPLLEGWHHLGSLPDLLSSGYVQYLVHLRHPHAAVQLGQYSTTDISYNLFIIAFVVVVVFSIFLMI